MELQANGGWMNMLDTFSVSEIARSVDLGNRIMDEEIVISDGTQELPRTIGYDLVKNKLSTVVIEDEKINIDGRKVYHTTPRFLGTYTFFT
jgi:hypothetical protein